MGGTVQPLNLKDGPDLLCGLRGRNFLVEVKNPSSERGRPSTTTLSAGQQRWHDAWQGQVAVVEYALEVYALAQWPCECGHLVSEHEPAGDGKTRACAWCRGSRRKGDNCAGYRPRSPGC